MTTALQVYNGKALPQPIYKSDPYVVISPREHTVVTAGTLDEIKKLHTQYSGYYDKCEVKVREHDLDGADNTKIADQPKTDNRPQTFELADATGKPYTFSITKNGCFAITDIASGMTLTGNMIRMINQA